MIDCPNCGQNLRFNIPLQAMYCESCNSSFDPYQFDSKTEDGIEHDEYETTIFTCPQCGGEIASTDTDITGFCTFCGAATIFYSRLEKELKPDYILPFRKSKEECKMAYAAKAKRNPYIPKEYRDIKYIDGFRGIYMPYWSYDVDQLGPVVLKGEKTHRSGDYIIHENYDLKGSTDSFYHGMVYDASSSFSDDISEKLAPFNIKEKKSFTGGFLSGFYADTADVSKETYQGKALNFANQKTMDLIKQEPAFRGYSLKSSSKLDSKVSKVQRTLLPVWFMSYRKGDRVAYATVNGQTGKVVADFPISLGRFYAGAAILAVILFFLLNLMFTVQARTTAIFSGIISVVALILYLAEESQIGKRESKTDDAGFMSKLSKKKQKEAKKAKGHTQTLPVVMDLIAMGLSILCFMIHSIHDELYYIVDLIAAAMIAVTLLYLIKDYNMMATRKLPQFDKTGGDDDAK